MWLIFSWNHCCWTRWKSTTICFCFFDKGLMPMLRHQSGWRTISRKNSTTQVTEVWRCVNKQKWLYVWPQDATTMSLVVNHSKQIGQALIKITLLSWSSCLQRWTIGTRNVDSPNPRCICSSCCWTCLITSSTWSRVCKAFEMSTSNISQSLQIVWYKYFPSLAFCSNATTLFFGWYSTSLTMVCKFL